MTLSPEQEKAARLDRARRAREVLTNPVMSEAFTALEALNVEQLLSFGPAMDLERRDKVNQINALRAVRAQLEYFISSGEAMSKAAVNRP